MRKRLQQIFLSNPERLPPDFSSFNGAGDEDEDNRDAFDPSAGSSHGARHNCSSASAFSDSERSHRAPGGDLQREGQAFSSPLLAPAEALRPLPPLLRAVVGFWGACLRRHLRNAQGETEEDEESVGYVSQHVGLFLRGMARNFQDACRLRLVMKTHAEGGLGMEDEVTVEESTEGQEISLDLLDSEAFATLMHAVGAEKKGHDQSTLWAIPPSLPQELLEASVRRFHELSQLQKAVSHGCFSTPVKPSTDRPPRLSSTLSVGTL